MYHNYINIIFVIYLYILYDISYHEQILKTKIGKKVFGKNF